MKAVVMAGGQGTRLRPLTSNQPKPMVPVVNKPTIQHILELVQRHGINEVVITLAFMPRLIRNHLGDGSQLGMHIDYTVEETPAGTAGSIRLAKDLLDDTFMVISGDALTDFDLTGVIAFHRERQAMVTIALKSVGNPLEFGVVIVDEEGRIQRFLEKPGWGQVFSDTVNTGIYIIEPEVFDHIPEGQPYDFSHDLFPKLFEMKKPLYGMVCDGYWQDIGSLEQFLQANRDALDGKVKLTPPGVRLRGNIWVDQGAALDSLENVEGPAVIGKNVRLDPGARVLAHAVLGDNVVLRSGAQVGSSVLGENVYLAAGAVVQGAVLGDAVEVHENAYIAEGAVIGDRTIVGHDAVVANNVKVYPFKTIEPGSTVRSSIVWETRGPSALFGRNGVRGLANVDVTPDMAMRLAMSYGSLVGKDTYVTTSRDTHHACRVFKRAIISGLNSTGVNVRDLTIAPLAINRFDIKSGNAIGGIHVQMCLENPEQIEILFSESPGVPLDGKKERAIENLFFREDFRRAPIEEMGQVLYPPRAVETYTNSLLDNWNTVSIRGRQPRLVLDYSASAPAFFFSATLDQAGSGDHNPQHHLPRTWPLHPGGQSALRGGAGRPAGACRGRRSGGDPGPGGRVPLRGRRERRVGAGLGPASAPAAAGHTGRRRRGGGGAPARNPLGGARGGLHGIHGPTHQVLQGCSDGRGHPAEYSLRRQRRRRLHLPGGAALHGRPVRPG